METEHRIFTSTNYPNTRDRSISFSLLCKSGIRVQEKLLPSSVPRWMVYYYVGKDTRSIEPRTRDVSPCPLKRDGR